MTTTTGTWHSHHLFLHCDAEETDAFLLRTAAPLLDGLVESGHADRWFFIRYGEDGPHLRIRAHGPHSAALDRLPAELALAAKEVPSVPGQWPSRHGEVRTVPYVPETGRYGGPGALPVAEEVFTDSTRAALDALPGLTRAADRLTRAADLAHATAHGLGMDPLAAARWLRRHAAGWRWVEEVPLLPGAAVHSRVNSVYATQREGLVRRAADLRERLAAGTAQPGLVRWAARVREADALMRGGAGAQGLPQEAAHWVWASQLHMLFNRLGVSPDEERAVCRLAARTLLEPGETTGSAPEEAGWFPQAHTAPDLRYLERSKFQIGRGEDSALRSPAADPQRAPGTGRPETALPADPLPATTLRDALAARASVRGPLGGPLGAGALGALLWHSLAESGRTEHHRPDGSVLTAVHRPHPSAGALYTARVRLVVLDVAGVAPGTYDCVPERRTLRYVGPAPEVAELKALSTYLSRPATDPAAIGIDAAPVFLGLYADLGLLRSRYGLRALRLALLETGHLAQNLLLVAAALGLGGTTLGGFHDDLAHELFGLDDLTQPLQYLLPLGRHPDARAVGPDASTSPHAATATVAPAAGNRS
ncbi:thiopeptide-type bacteriocin biosynthesis protein [Streptomyces sp. NPDC058623]|uniref:thiopeptide-type bacteriocin biosynthesis protein n=1 Tax=Streptomyces sp. NPDC058623 TaxID=3346563 RepID=UPI003651D1A5